MSREQRRSERRQQDRAGGSRAGGTPPPSRRTPVKVSGGSGFPTIPVAVAGGVMLIVLLIAYLIFQSGSGGGGLSGAEQAEQDRSTSLPGTYAETQGRGHFTGGLAGHQMTPFCDGVTQSDTAKLNLNKADGNTTPNGTTSPTPAATSSPAPTATNASGTPGSASSGTANATPTVPTNCYNTNPPSSGKHLNVARNVDVGSGKTINLPPDPDVYPPPIEVPRDAIPHILEHSGVFVGYHCKDGDSDCQGVVDQLGDVVNDRINNHDNRVVMALDTDLPEGTIGVSSWTRVLDFPVTDWNNQKGELARFISVHSCRFKPEAGFCP